MYTDKEGNVDTKSIIEDMFEWNDKCTLRRVLCLCSLISKYSRPFTCSYKELISTNDTHIDTQLVLNLVRNSQMSPTIITQVCTFLNNFKLLTPLELISLIIDKWIPTEYQFPSLRYYKIIVSHTSTEPSDYFSNRF